MVRGLDIFREYFAAYSGQYVLIGGTACSLALENAGLDFRVTKDLDIVLYVETLNAEFVNAFWEFIKTGKYQNKLKSNGAPQYYRFSEPINEKYPEILELFSRASDSLSLTEDVRLAPIPVHEDCSILSVILLDNDYYHFIQSGRVITSDGLSVIKPEYLIPLKIRAWMDFTQRKKNGHEISSTDVKKHRNDVFRLFQVIDLSEHISLDNQIQADIERGLDLITKDQSINLKSLGLKGISVTEVVGKLKKLYGIIS